MYKEKLEEALLMIDENHIKNIITELGGTAILNTDEYMVFDTICHGGDSHKLYYYKENKNFMCYTNCGFMSIIDFLIKVWETNFYDAVDRLRIKIGISKGKFTTHNETTELLRNDMKDSLELLQRVKGKSRDNIELQIYNSKILERYTDEYKEDWLNDNITSEAMKNFKIKYCYTSDSVVIPHFDLNGNLIGIRSRNFDEAMVAKMKYTPLFVENKVCKHPLGLNLYGIFENCENIRRKKEVLIVEGEKGVLQSESYFGREENVTLATCGSNLTLYQRDMIIRLGVEKVYIGFDKQWENKETEEYSLWIEKIEKIVLMLSPFVEVYIIWDNNDLLEYKDSPYDKGKDIAQRLINEACRDIMSLKEYEYANESEEKNICTQKVNMEMEKYLLSVEQ